MLASHIAAIALAIGIALSHAHAAAPAHTGSSHGSVAAFDGSGGGPPGHP